MSPETAKLSEAGREKVSGVITTNYDRMCEVLFPGFVTYVGEGGLLFSEQAYSQEIYKIHGSVEKPESIVLTDADYSEFAHKRKYLAAKLLTLFVEYPVIFLGYSIQDENIKGILGDICECLSADKLERLSRRLIFVQHAPETTISEFTMSFGEKALSMTKIATDDFESIYDALLASQRLYSTKPIRELRGNVYRLAEKFDPQSEVVAAGVDSLLNSLAPGQKVALQVAISPQKMGRPISREEIFEDVVLDTLHTDPKLIVEWFLNTYVRQTPNIMPVFKYVRDLGDEVGKDIAGYLSNLTSLDSFRTKSIRKDMGKIHKRFGERLSVMELVRKCDPKPAFYFIPYLYDNEIDVDELEHLLKISLLATREGSTERMALLRDSSFRKCVRIYDFLRYRKMEVPQPSPSVQETATRT